MHRVQAIRSTTSLDILPTLSLPLWVNDSQYCGTSSNSDTQNIHGQGMPTADPITQAMQAAE